MCRQTGSPDQRAHTLEALQDPARAAAADAPSAAATVKT